MKIVDKATPVAAVVAAFSSLACCMPLGLLGAVGLAGFAVWASNYRIWFIALAFLFLVAGAVQIYRGQRTCRRSSKGSVITFWTALGLVLFIFLFPQFIANVLAGVSR